MFNRHEDWGERQMALAYNSVHENRSTWWAAHPIIKLATKHSEIGSQIIVAGSMLIRSLVHLEKKKRIFFKQQPDYKTNQFFSK